jgi:hypothetical protein
MQHLTSVGIQLQQNKKQNCKAPQGRSSITEEGKRDAYYREQANGHTDIHGKVEEKYAHYAVTISTGKPALLAFGNKDDTHQQQDKKRDHN